MRGTESKDRFALVDTDGTACITGKYNECNRSTFRGISTQTT